jgi:hypothetical protein
MRNALILVHLEQDEPNLIFFEYAERYSRDELAEEEAVVDYESQVTNAGRASQAR